MSSTSANESVRDSGTESEINEIESHNDETSPTEYETESDSSTAEQASISRPVPQQRRLTSKRQAVTQSTRIQSDDSSNNDDETNSDADSGDTLSLEGTLSRPRPHNGYFAQAMQSTGSGTMNLESPLHTINSVQYAYSNASSAY